VQQSCIWSGELESTAKERGSVRTHSEEISLNIRGHSEVSQNTLDVSGGGVLSQSDE